MRPQELSKSLSISGINSVSMLALLALAFVIGGAATANAQAVTVYNNIPNPTPLNVFSQGVQSYAFNELGDGFTLAAKSSTLGTVTVIMQSWACQHGMGIGGGPGSSACVTLPGATYAMPVTVNVYSVVTGTSLEGVAGSSAPGKLLATATQTFNMPYRPSSDFVHCPASAAVSGGYYEWYDSTTQTCQNGIDFPIAFNLSRLQVELPSQIIVTISYNTSSYGPTPYGTSEPCYSTSGGCFYDWLNISGGALAAAYPGPVPAPSVGSVLNVSGIFTRFANANTAFCGTGKLPANTLALDASPGCYTGNHPMISVTAEPND